MKITHRAPAAASAPAVVAASLLPTAAPLLREAGLDKAPRLSCCCRLSELLPLVRQLHDAARAARVAGGEQAGVAA